MNIRESGISDTSVRYIHAPSVTAQQTFFCALYGGHYQCDSTYRLARSNFNNFLLFHVLDGSGYLEAEQKKYTFRQGDTVFIDCDKPHVYGTSSSLDFLWIHFNGATSRQYFELAQARENPIFHIKEQMQISSCLQKVLDCMKNGAAEHEALTSRYLVQILTYVLTSRSDQKGTSAKASTVEEIQTYINQNLKQPLTIEDMSSRASLSPYHFIRVFKQETGYTPHEYILNARIHAARLYLKSPNMSVKEIGYLCGFSSESSFCTTFKNLTGTTPSAYRES
ncbi:MAG: AraC family transcriptional regulator [Lachnospiraceae bacterium]|nr:AraC family transcriptional regulator [Lachnospiraceae bacterium]MDD3794729.1 AraC family transcriptional regulator [Lachnospiraceae bacterium]